MNVFTLAWRNVWRNTRRSGITIAAMTLALVAEVLYAGLVGGMIAGMEDDATEFDLGHVQVFVDGYPTRPSLYDAVPQPDALVSQIEAAGHKATARLFSGGLAAVDDASAGVMFMGVDPVRDANTLSLADAIGEGDWLDLSDPKGIVIGRGLARTLGADLGTEVLVVSQAADGSIANDLLTVRGILMSVGSATDRATIVMTTPAFRELMVLPDGAHKIVVVRDPEAQLADVAATVSSLSNAHIAAIDGAPDVDVMTWEEISPFLAQWLQSAEAMILIVYFIVYIAVAILILNAMLMAVFERIREFGVLKAIGFAPTKVLAMIVIEGMLQACVALVLGLTLAAPAMWYLGTHGIDVGVLGGVQMAGMTMPAIWKGVYTWSSIQAPIFMLFFIVFLAVIYPAIKAARISPVEAMHHQ